MLLTGCAALAAPFQNGSFESSGSPPCNAFNQSGGAIPG